MALQCLVFDCDGVLLDSVPIKTRAYARIAEPLGPGRPGPHGAVPHTGTGRKPP